MDTFSQKQIRLSNTDGHKIVACLTFCTRKLALSDDDDDNNK